MRAPWTLAAALAILSLPATTRGARTDVVVLDNGDHITGEVKTLERGQLRFKTDDAGTLSIAWDVVASLTADATFEVQTRSGERLLGSLRPGSAGGQLLVVEADGARELARLEIVGISRIKDSFLSRIEGSVDVGLSYAKSNDLKQGSVNATASFRKPKFAVSLRVHSIQSFQDSGTDTERQSLVASYERDLGGRWVFLGLGRFERNRELDLAGRTLAGLALGRDLVRTNRTVFRAAAGLSANREETFAGGAGTTQSEGLFGLEFSRFAYHYPKTEITVWALLSPSFSQSGRVRFEIDVRLRRELVKDFYLGLSFFNSFDNQAGVEQERKNDLGGSVSLGWSF